MVRRQKGDVMPIQEICLEAFDPGVHSKNLRDWLHRPHVVRWWGDPQVAFENSLRCSPGRHAVIVADKSPVGYLCWQTPPQSELEVAGLADFPAGLADIDVLIGEPGFMGRGVGPRSLGLLLARLRADPFVTVAGVGTSVSNKRAIRAFEKAGFRLFREFEDPEYGSCLYLTVEVRDRI